MYRYRVEGSSKATGRPHTPIEQLKKTSHSKHKKKKKHDAPERESASKKEPGDSSHNSSQSKREHGDSYQPKREPGTNGFSAFILHFREGVVFLNTMVNSVRPRFGKRSKISIMQDFYF